MLLTAAVSGVRGSGGETVDLWLELTEPTPQPQWEPAAKARQHERVAAQQAAVSQALGRLGAVELARIHGTGNAIAVRIDASRVDELRLLPGVKRVRPARTLHPPKQVP
jgi:hypothetical protein